MAIPRTYPDRVRPVGNVRNDEARLHRVRRVANGACDVEMPHSDRVLGEMAVPKRALPRDQVHDERTLTGLTRTRPGLDVRGSTDRPFTRFIAPMPEVKAPATIRSRDLAREQGEKPAQDRKEPPPAHRSVDQPKQAFVPLEMRDRQLTLG